VCTMSEHTESRTSENTTNVPTSQSESGIGDNLPKAKKLTKSEKRKRKDEEMKKERKEKRTKQRRRKKEKRKDKINEILARGGEPTKELPKKKRVRESDCPTLGTTRVVIDLGYDNLMNDAEIGSLVSQLVYCHGQNRRQENPFREYWTNFGGRFKTALQKMQGWEQWKIEKTESSYIEIFEKEKENLVYLTADTDNVLKTLDPTKIYIIGGLVDKNRHKGLCAKKAQEQGIATARLPIEEYLLINSRKVITVNQVFDILLRVSRDGDSVWPEALNVSIPQRKIRVPGTEGEN